RRDPGPAPGGRTRARVLASVVAVLALLVGIGWTANRSLDRIWARGEAVLEIRRLADAEEYEAALEVGERALRILPDLPVLDSLVDLVSGTPTVETEPSGAAVAFRDYQNPDAPWTDFGRTPLSDRRLPLGLRRWRFTLEGHDTVDAIGGAGPDWSLRMPPEGSIPDGMVLVPGGTTGGFIDAIGPLPELPFADYYIDRYEVTNASFAEFVDAGGYEREEFWTREFVLDGEVIGWADAMERFVDATGRPGPATWELGRPPRGEESLPVTGVSWYEAAAYAEYRGKSLPTLRHWVVAAGTGGAGVIIPLSNFEGEGPAAPGTFQGMSPFGAFDMAGNVREWVLNSAGDRRHALGGAWSDLSYFFSGPNAQPPFDRLPVNGFRLAQYTRQDDFGGDAAGDVPLMVRDYTEERPVADEIFEVYAAQFAYDPTPLDAVVEEELEYEFGRVEVVSFEGVGWGRIRAYLYLPEDAQPPYQTVIWFPGSTAARPGPDPDPRTNTGSIEHFVASGRAVLLPILRGTHSRAEPDQPLGMSTTWPKPTREYVDFARSWVSEVRRSIDYLESRPDIDTERLAYYGTSWGGRYGAIVPAVEPRLSLSMLVVGGLASGSALPEVDQINFVTRVTVPTLMLNGRYDPLQPVETAQLPMYRLLGAPAEDKRHVIYEGYGHAVPPNERVRETLDWLDRYFGPPSPAG
ncbi:MAG TPA: SUMF1/EgtB/PvdO family nonheme iron enzyme, partial [Longimicrobiales bacterium]|nr:SUMF1/EgtB/PvdO family nonheme iron enzyme [Longimicrobiales bacterium]